MHIVVNFDNFCEEILNRINEEYLEGLTFQEALDIEYTFNALINNFYYFILKTCNLDEDEKYSLKFTKNFWSKCLEDDIDKIFNR